MKLSALYSDKIIEIAGALPVFDRLDNPDVTVRKTSRVCGSAVTVDLQVRNGVVTGYAHDVSACALGQTSCSIVGRHIQGATTQELRHLKDDVEAMLKTGGAPPSGRWDEIKYLQPVREYSARHASTLLVFDAIVACLDEIDAGRDAIKLTEDKV